MSLRQRADESATIVMLGLLELTTDIVEACYRLALPDGPFQDALDAIEATKPPVREYTVWHPWLMLSSVAVVDPRFWGAMRESVRLGLGEEH